MNDEQSTHDCVCVFYKGMRFTFVIIFIYPYFVLIVCWCMCERYKLNSDRNETEEEQNRRYSTISGWWSSMVQPLAATHIRCCGTKEQQQQHMTLIACTNIPVQPIEIFNECTQSLLHPRYLVFGFWSSFQRERGMESGGKSSTLKKPIRPTKSNSIFSMWSMYLIQFDQLFHWIIQFFFVFPSLHFLSFWFIIAEIANGTKLPI